MKEVIIYSLGHCMNMTDKSGYYEVMLTYNGKGRYVKGSTIENTTANRTIIMGLIAGVKMLKEPCKLLLCTATAIGMSKFLKNGKGVNGDYLRTLMEVCEENGHIFEYRTIEKGEIERIRNALRR